MDVYRLEKELEIKQQENNKLKIRNQILEAEVKDLKQGLEAIEERARSELGMIKKDETFFHIIDDDEKSNVKKEGGVKPNDKTVVDNIGKTP